jgi:hypothetical protein
MPGKAVKITLTEGQREILLMLRNAAGETSHLQHCRVDLGVSGATLPPRGGTGPTSESLLARSDR